MYLAMQIVKRYPTLLRLYFRSPTMLCSTYYNNDNKCNYNDKSAERVCKELNTINVINGIDMIP